MRPQRDLLEETTTPAKESDEVLDYLQRRCQEERLLPKDLETAKPKKVAEQIAHEGKLAMAWYEHETGRYRIEEPGFECIRCGTLNEANLSPEEKKILEPQICEYCGKRGPFLPNKVIENLVLSPPWKLPELGDYHHSMVLWDRIVEYLRSHVHLGQSFQYEFLTAWIVASWFKDTVPYTTHLMVEGPTQSGKTRLLKTISRVAYRSYVSASFTASALFRRVNEQNATLLMSEYHDMTSEQKMEVDSVIKAGQKEGEYVDRVEHSVTRGYWVKSFNPFSQIAIGTQWPPRLDIVNRCYLLRMSPQPDVRKTINEDEAAKIRNGLMRLRVKTLHDFENLSYHAGKKLEEKGLQGRPYERFLGIATAMLLLRGDLDVLDKIIEYDIEKQKRESSKTKDAKIIMMLMAVHKWNKEELDRSDPVSIPLRALRDLLIDKENVEISLQALGRILARHDIEAKRYSYGKCIEDLRLKEKLDRISPLYGLDYNEIEPVSLDEAQERLGY